MPRRPYDRSPQHLVGTGTTFPLLNSRLPSLGALNRTQELPRSLNPKTSIYHSPKSFRTCQMHPTPHLTLRFDIARRTVSTGTQTRCRTHSGFALSDQGGRLTLPTRLKELARRIGTSGLCATGCRFGWTLWFGCVFSPWRLPLLIICA